MRGGSLLCPVGRSGRAGRIRLVSTLAAHFAVTGFSIISRAFTRLFLGVPAAIIHTMTAQSASLDGIEMYYEIEGSGDPLLLLHGGTGSHDDWVYAGRRPARERVHAH